MYATQDKQPSAEKEIIYDEFTSAYDKIIDNFFKEIMSEVDSFGS